MMYSRPCLRPLLTVRVTILLLIQYSFYIGYDFSAILTNKMSRASLGLTIAYSKSDWNNTQLSREASPRLPDCMTIAYSKSDWKNTQLSKEANLCQAFKGRTARDCVYNHTNVIHYMKLMQKLNLTDLTFQEYISILSVNKFYKPEKIVIHCNRQHITGPYWEKASKLNTPIELRQIDRVVKIGGKKPGFITHEVDFLKVKTALEEGGIFMDFDTAILNGTKFREWQSVSECVFGRDNDLCTRTCAGFFSCVQGSKFIEKWLKGYQTSYNPSEWVYNAGDYPSNLLRKRPHCHDIYIDSLMSNWIHVKFKSFISS